MERAESKAFDVVEFKADDERRGYFKATVAVFDNVDRVNDVLMKGAFVDTLATKGLPPVVWTHRWDIPPIGRTLSAQETEKGLEIEAELFVDDHEIARQVYAGMKGGALKEFSFAYVPTDAEYQTKDGEDVRVLKAVELIEVGPTLVGVNPDTELHRVKGEGKAGARNNAEDAARLQRIHDLANACGATCGAEKADDETRDKHSETKSEETSDTETEEAEASLPDPARAIDLLVARPE